MPLAICFSVSQVVEAQDLKFSVVPGVFVLPVRLLTTTSAEGEVEENLSGGTTLATVESTANGALTATVASKQVIPRRRDLEVPVSVRVGRRNFTASAFRRPEESQSYSHPSAPRRSRHRANCVTFPTAFAVGGVGVGPTRRPD